MCMERPLAGVGGDQNYGSLEGQVRFFSVVVCVLSSVYDFMTGHT